MNTNEKINALLTAAKAYIDRGCRIQYDQLSMDRLVRITPRRRYILPPEAATSQQMLYLDCATFVCAAFYNAFGQLLEADITWNMRELVEDCMFYYTVTGTETPEEIRSITEKIQSIIQPGDALVVSRANNGHIMLYVDEDTYYHCTTGGVQGSYDYQNRRDVNSPRGGMFIDDPHWWFAPASDAKLQRRYLFREGIQKFALLRPLNHMGDPTPDTIARMTTAKDLFFEVTVSHSGGQTANVGDTVTYTLSVENRRTDAAETEVHFDAPSGCDFSGEAQMSAVIAAGDRQDFVFSVTVGKTDALQLDMPVITANGLHVYAPHVLIGKNLTDSEAELLIRTAEEAAAAKKSTPDVIAEAYRALDITVPTRYNLLLRSLFYRHDSRFENVWSRRVQTPRTDMAVYSYFGGIGVITPQMSSDLFVRTTQLRMDDLQAGDILLCSDDHTGLKSYAALYTGKGFLGSTEYKQPPTFIGGEEAAVWLDTLPGRFAYIILRPSQTK